jgi:hypothetical protein
MLLLQRPTLNSSSWSKVWEFGSDWRAALGMGLTIMGHWDRVPRIQDLELSPDFYHYSPIILSISLRPSVLLNLSCPFICKAILGYWTTQTQQNAPKGNPVLLPFPHRYFFQKIYRLVKIIYTRKNEMKHSKHYLKTVSRRAWVTGTVPF